MPEAALHPATVGSTFMRQYYHFLAKEPESLHRFYKNESRWCHGVGSQMQEPITGQQAIHGEILRRDYKGARVDLDHGSIDCQGSLQDGVLVLVTGVMTLASSPVPKPFVQTFFLAVQPNGYFVLNDCLRFLELQGTQPADPVVAVKDVKSPPTPQRAIGTPAAAVPHATPAPASPVKPVAVASPVKPKTVASPAPTKPQASPVKSPAPEKAVTPAAAAAVASPAAKSVSPVKKAAVEPEKKAVTPKPSETKPAAPASPAPVKPASPVKQQPVVAPKPVEPAAPKTWAALFTPTPTTPSAAAAPAPAKASPAPKAATASPPKSTKASTDAAPAASASTTTAAASAAPPQPAKEGRPRYFSLYIRDVPPQTKDTDLRELFKAHGTIANVTVPQGRGIAFVDFVEQESMRAALAAGEYKLFDKVIQVDERTERKDKDRSGFRSDSRGGRGRGYGPKGRTGDRKDRDDGNKERRERDPASSNGAAAASNGPRSTGDRREKGGRRANKEEGGRGGNRTQ
ncbi:hypothetical protein PINS_up001573 [Pythium insidiosum]|nr:hypothetical protein PINS_up001573 [Pythium insidiosum]